MLRIIQELDAIVGEAEQGCDEQLVSNTVGAQRRATECRGRNVWLFMVCSYDSITDVTRVSVIDAIIFHFLLERPNYM